MRKIDFRLGLIIVYVCIHYFEIHMKLSYFFPEYTWKTLEKKCLPG